MNIGNILKVADAIEQASVPGLGFNMSYMLELKDKNVSDPRQPSCGTVACIAGWAYTLKQGEVTPIGYEAEMPAQEWLELDRDTARALFYPEPITEELELEWGEVTPKQAASCLRNLAITGEVDWMGAMKDNEPKMPSLPSPLPAKRERV